MSEIAARPVGQQELLSRVRSGNRAAIESIHTLSCKYNISAQTPDGKETQFPSGEYFRSIDTFRIKWRLGSRWADGVVKDGRSLGLAGARDREGRQHVGGTITHYGRMPAADCDPWYHSLFTFFGDMSRRPVLLTFDELLSEPYKLRRTEEVVEDGRPLAAVEVEFASDSTTVFLLDPQVNYLVRKTRSSSVVGGHQPRTVAASCEVMHFVEAAPGIFFPARVVTKQFRDGNLQFTQTVEFSDIIVNHSLPRGVFDFKFPARTEVHDLIHGKKYVAGDDGNPAGKLRDLATAPPPPRGMAAHVETREEPQSWTRWVLPASLATLSLASCLWAVRKWKGSRSP